MDYLYLAPMDGLFHEFSSPENLETANTIGILNNNIIDGNLKFWNELLSIKKIEALLNQLDNNILTEWADIPQYLSINSNKELFLENVSHAKYEICDQNIPQQTFFSYLETLSITCKLYSDLIFYPHTLDLQNGFLLNEYSSSEIFNNCLNAAKNPYLNFIEAEILPLILKHKPKVLFLLGKPSFYNMAVAKLTKKHLPDTHISISRHSSEYYSMNKITDYLQKNDILFKMIDSIVLEYFRETEEKLVEFICNKDGEIENIGNIMYRNNTQEVIINPKIIPQDKDKIQVYYRSSNQQKGLEISPDTLVDIHLEPYVKCHWNKCTFCGINKKYSYNDTIYEPTDFIKRLEQVKSVTLNGVKYIWFIDEAISVSKLKKLAKYIVTECIHIKWQARCRIDDQLLDEDMVRLFAISGLTELRMGLESASINVLKDMNKFEEPFSLDLVTEIVALYSKYGISIHFPMIIGFPTETIADRQKTYAFLSELKEKYPLFTFNINIFQLDVCSEVFKRWDRYALYKIEFPCNTNEFLGNWANYSAYTDNTILSDEQDQFMREKLTPWMPEKSILKPHIFYRLSETIRNTLIWKSKKLLDDNKVFYSYMYLKTADNLTVSFNETQDTYIIYNWDNHHYMKGNQLLVEVLQEWNVPQNVTKGISNLCLNHSGIYSEDDLVILIRKLIYYEYLIEVNSTEKEITSLQSFYNNMYKTEIFPYRLQPDTMLRNWKNFIPVGKVLDLGIGMGKNVDYLLDEGNTIVGVDYSEVAIKKLMKKYSSPKCEFINDDINTFNIPPSSFSLIICSLVFSHLNEKQIKKLSRKMIDGLVPNGCIYICDLSEKDPMHKMEKCPTSKRRILTSKYILDLFQELEIIDIVDSFQKEPKRVDYGGYFGLINFLGRKNEKGGTLYGKIVD